MNDSCNQSAAMPHLVVALAGDKSYFLHLSACVNSILSNTRNHNRLELLILDGGLLADQKNFLREMAKKFTVEINFEDKVAIQYKDFPVNRRIATSPTYYRISLAEIIPRRVPYALYLDSDTIVEEDVFELLQHANQKQFAVWAVEDISASRAHQLLGIKKSKYFNAGVMLINLDYWRKNNVGEQIRDYKLQNPEKILGNDGGAINAILCDSWGRLPPKWNQQSGLYKNKFRRPGRLQYSTNEINDALRRPAIIHYVGARKPWLPGCPHPLSKRYWFYRRNLGLAVNEIKFVEELGEILKKPHHFIRKWWYKLRFSSQQSWKVGIRSRI